MAQMNESLVNKPYWGTDVSDSINFHFSWIKMILLALATLTVVEIVSQFSDDKLKAPFMGYRSALEPRWLVRLRFSRGALPMVQEGYRKVSLTQ